MSNRIALRQFSLVLALLLIWGYFALRSGDFVSPRNLSQLAIELSITATLALGMLLIILPGHIDLAVGSGVGLFGGLAAVLVFEHNWPAAAALALALLAAVVVWCLMGAVIVRERIPAFIITLAGLLVYKGLHWLVIHNSTIPVTIGGRENVFSLLTTYYLPPWSGYLLAAAVVGGLAYAQIAARTRRRKLGLDLEPADLPLARLLVAGQLVLLFVLVTNQYRGVPLSALILAATAVLVYLLTQHTPFGRYLYAIGGNPEAALISGVPVNAVVIGAFAAMGVVVGVTGFMQTAYQGSSSTTVGNLMELDAIAACVIGGASLRGGRGSVAGVLFGALIMASLLNGLTLLAVQPEKKMIARGLVLALAVWMDVRLARA